MEPTSFQMLVDGAVLWFVVSTVVGNMPEPREDCSGFWYRWLYGTLQSLAANSPAFMRSRRESK